VSSATAFHPAGAIGTLVDGQLVVLGASTSNSPVLDTVASLDVFALEESLGFTGKMRVRAWPASAILGAGRQCSSPPSNVWCWLVVCGYACLEHRCHAVLPLPCCIQVEAAAQLEALEAWAERQARGLELASAGKTEHLASSFDSLLKVMDALYQVRAQCSAPAMRPNATHLRSCI
jgi:hypothetical protein